MDLNDLVSRGEVKTDLMAIACGTSRDDSQPLKFTNVDGSFACFSRWKFSDGFIP